MIVIIISACIMIGMACHSYAEAVEFINNLNNKK